MRTAAVERNTKETQIRLRLGVDGNGSLRKIATPCPSSTTCWTRSRATACIDLELEARGDVEVDGHHTVEDVGLVLGQALPRGARRQAAASAATASH